MPTQVDLKKYFRAYLEDIEKCISGSCFWALLHMLIVLPDICSAMEADDGQATDGRFRNWCKRYLDDAAMKSSDWYRLRCLILHQGRTHDEEGKSRYVNFRFSHSRIDSQSMHRRVEEVEGGQMLHLDVRRLAEETRTALARWFNWVETQAPKEIVENVDRNARSLAQKSVITASPEAPPFQTFTVSVTSSPRF